MTLRPHDDHELRWKLLENGIDFIRSGVEAYFDTPRTPRPSWIPPVGRPTLPNDVEDFLEPGADTDADDASRPDHAYKYAILHLHAGCLLLFKERLRQGHECLIYQRIDGSFDDPKRRPKTVDFDQALGRLSTWAGVELDGRVRRCLRTLQTLRNDLEHFEVKLNKQHAEAVVTSIVEFAYRFLRDELQTQLEHEISPKAWRHVSQLRSIAERIAAEAAQDWKRRADECRNMSDADLQELAEQDEYHPKHNPDARDPIWCEECDTQSVHVVAPDLLVCTNTECRRVFEADACLRCGEPVYLGATCCDNCEGYIDHVMSKD